MRVPAAVMVFAFLSLLLAYLCVLNEYLYGALLIFGIYFYRPFSPPIMLFSAVALLSMFYIWLPAILNFAWLPVQLFRRTHNAQKIRNTLNALLYSSLLLIALHIILYFLRNTQDSSAPASAIYDPRSVLNFSGLCFIMIGMCVYLNRMLI